MKLREIWIIPEIGLFRTDEHMDHLENHLSLGVIKIKSNKVSHGVVPIRFDQT